MFNVLFIWVLKLFYNTQNNFKTLRRVLRIKLKTPIIKVNNQNEINKIRSEKFHLALRLNNDHFELSKRDLFQLIEYIHNIFNIKYLTIIVGKAGFEREIGENFSPASDSWIDQIIFLYHNYQLIFTPLNTPTPGANDIKVNLIYDNNDHFNSDSQNIFLLKLREFLYSNSAKVKVVSEIYEAAVKNFTSK